MNVFTSLKTDWYHIQVLPPTNMSNHAEDKLMCKMPQDMILIYKFIAPNDIINIYL